MFRQKAMQGFVVLAKGTTEVAEIQNKYTNFQ